MASVFHAVVRVNHQTIDVTYVNGETVTVNGLGGNDLIVMDDSAFTWSAAFVGGAGNDTLVGGDGVDRFEAADGEADLLIVDVSDGKKKVNLDPFDAVVVL